MSAPSSPSQRGRPRIRNEQDRPGDDVGDVLPETARRGEARRRPKSSRRSASSPSSSPSTTPASTARRSPAGAVSRELTPPCSQSVSEAADTSAATHDSESIGVQNDVDSLTGEVANLVEIAFLLGFPRERWRSPPGAPLRRRRLRREVETRPLVELELAEAPHPNGHLQGELGLRAGQGP